MNVVCEEDTSVTVGSQVCVGNVWGLTKCLWVSNDGRIRVERQVWSKLPNRTDMSFPVVQTPRIVSWQSAAILILSEIFTGIWKQKLTVSWVVNFSHISDCQRQRFFGIYVFGEKLKSETLNLWYSFLPSDFKNQNCLRLNIRKLTQNQILGAKFNI